MHANALILCLLLSCAASAQKINTKGLDKDGPVKVKVSGKQLAIDWPVSDKDRGVLLLDLEKDNPLFKSIFVSGNGQLKEIVRNLDPVFLLTVGKRSLDSSSGGWDVFFDRVATKPYQTYTVDLEKNKATILSKGSQTTIRISTVRAATFKGDLEITLFNGSPLLNIAAVMATAIDSTAILYDAGFTGSRQPWEKVSWSDTKDQLQSIAVHMEDSSIDQAVKYRTIIGTSAGGSLAIFPSPHQYFCPLDEAFNLKFTWVGGHYKKMLPGYGMGIRQEPQGDHRYTPWFNAPPHTRQRLNFFCWLSTGDAGTTLEEVKKFTHKDRYPDLPGYKTLQSHFHNEFTMSVVLKGKPIPEEPNFVKVFKDLGVNIVHLAEFHGPGHPKGPDSSRLKELSALFGQCSRLSVSNFLLLPGEEVNNFYGGHWLAFFPRPVYWVMSRPAEIPFLTEMAGIGKVYHVSDKNEMLKLLELENGLSWTAHARTKASVGYPDGYKNEPFYTSDHFLGGAWKNIPADLSLPTLSQRVLRLMDNTNNRGLKKQYIGECDIFSMEPENETYAHVNVNYLQLDKLPEYSQGWQPILDSLRAGKFFTTTGEILLPSFTVNDKGAGKTVQLPADGKATVTVTVDWTFPLNFIEIVSGDGKKVYRKRIDLKDTQAFGKKGFSFPIDLKHRKWVRLEAWDIAADGAFTQTVWVR